MLANVAPLRHYIIINPCKLSQVFTTTWSTKFGRLSFINSFFFAACRIPDTPAEPDLEIHPVTVPPVIPLDDISGSQDSINDFSAFKWPEPKQFVPDNTDLNAMKGFIAGMPPPIFPPFPDGTFPPPFGQPFFPGGTVPPLPVPNNWNVNIDAASF